MTEEVKESKCIILKGDNQFDYGSKPVPELKEKEVLIKVIAAPINPSDVYLIAGTYPTSKKHPLVPGIEGAGQVVKSGGGQIGKGLVGKKVAFAAEGNGPFGTYSQYTIVQEHMCIVLEEETSCEQGSMSFINPLTVYFMLEQLKENKLNSVVHTAGNSQLGRMMTKYFGENGVDVISIVRKKEQIELLQKEVGAKYVLNSSDPDFEKQFQ